MNRWIILLFSMPSNDLCHLWARSQPPPCISVYARAITYASMYRVSSHIPSWDVNVLSILQPANFYELFMSLRVFEGAAWIQQCMDIQVAGWWWWRMGRWMFYIWQRLPDSALGATFIAIRSYVYEEWAKYVHHLKFSFSQWKCFIRFFFSSNGKIYEIHLNGENICINKWWV